MRNYTVQVYERFSGARPPRAALNFGLLARDVDDALARAKAECGKRFPGHRVVGAAMTTEAAVVAYVTASGK